MFFYTCDVNEKLEDPCGDDLELTVTGNYTLFSEDHQIIESFPARNAKVEIYKANNDPEQPDILVGSGTLDGGGKYTFIPKNSGCGINNLYFSVTYSETSTGIPIYQRTNVQDYLCCDDNFDFEFNEFMSDMIEIPLDCDALNHNIQVNITNKQGVCIPIGSEISALSRNKMATTELDNIVIDISPLLDMENGFWVDSRSGIHPQPDEEGKVFLNNQIFSITFGVETAVDSLYQAEVKLPISCINENGEATQNGEISISFTADVCDNSVSCSCPIGNNEIFPVNLRDIKIVSTSKRGGENFSSGKLGNLIDVDLADGCKLFVNKIVRYKASKDAYNSNDEAWNIVEPKLPMQIVDFYDFEILANFEPNSVDEYNETFEVLLSVHNEDDTDIKECSFLITFKGKGCVDVCATIRINEKEPGYLYYTEDESMQNFSANDIFSFDEKTEIHQKMAVGLANNTCFNVGGDVKTLSYTILFPDDIEDFCLNHSISISKLSTIGDEQYFDIEHIYKEPFYKGNNIDMNVNFYPPTVQQLVNRNRDENFTGRFKVDIISSDDRIVCSQIIQIDAQVNQVDFSESEQQVMHSFSQISELDTRPAYRVYQIGYERSDKLFGRVVSLKQYNEETGRTDVIVDEITGQSSPGNSENAAFYFEVDDPNDTDFNNQQLPKLYLVDNMANRFNYITRIPVEYYSNADDFRDNRQDLIRKMFSSMGFISPFNSTNFSFSPNDLMGRLWNNSLHKSHFTPGNGIELELGGVYILWNSNTSRLSGLVNDVFGGYCDVALLYITEIEHGKGINTHHISSVSFVVGYPLEIIK